MGEARFGSGESDGMDKEMKDKSDPKSPKAEIYASEIPFGEEFTNGPYV